MDSVAFYPDDEIDELFARSNPNPTRHSCPPRDALIALAERARPITDPGYGHLAHCSPCYQEARPYRAAQARRRRVGVARTVTWLVTVALIVLALASLFWGGREDVPPRHARQESRPADLHTEFDRTWRPS